MEKINFPTCGKALILRYPVEALLGFEGGRVRGEPHGPIKLPRAGDAGAGPEGKVGIGQAVRAGEQESKGPEAGQGTGCSRKGGDNSSCVAESANALGHGPKGSGESGLATVPCLRRCASQGVQGTVLTTCGCWDCCSQSVGPQLSPGSSFLDAPTLEEWVKR